MNTTELNKQLKFIDNYKHASNAATGSALDSNANVTTKNIATLQGELGKKQLLELNRAITQEYLTKRYGKEMADSYIKDLDRHIIYTHDETSIMPYCCAISLYPFILNGLEELGGSSCAPKHTNGFIGGVVNLLFLVAGQFAGAVAIPEFFPYMDHFLRKDFGNDYINHLDDEFEFLGSTVTLRNKIYDWFQQFVYSINQPAGARMYQSPFTNIAYFDKYYFESIFKGFVFPFEDSEEEPDVPCYETTAVLQKMFMKWFNQERTKTHKSVLTFPVETANILYDKETHSFKDKEMADFIAEMWSEGHSFFLYQSDSVDALSSCCFEGSELITIRNKETEAKLSLPIREFCENYKDKFKQYETLSFNPQTGENEYADITGILIKNPEEPEMIKIECEDGIYLKVTPDHLFWVKSDLGDIELRADELDNGNYRLVKDNEPISFNIGRVAASEKVYDIELSKNHWFYANGILTHNCRLRNEIEDNVFSYTLGAGGIETGSKRVITVNLNRLVQDWYKEYKISGINLPDYITPLIENVHKYLIAWNDKLWDDFNDGILTVYSAGFIDLDKQFLTVGVNGFVEAAEFLRDHTEGTIYEGIDISPRNAGYRQLSKDILGTIKALNKKDRTEHTRFNAECVPAENAAAKLYNWDKQDGYVVPEGRNLYNSYFYVVEDQNVNPVEKFFYHGDGFASECDGGVALHNNLSEHLTKAQYRHLMDVAAEAGCNYFTFNIPNTVCNDCGHVDKRMLHKCPHCGSENLDYLTRVIGYLKRVSNFSEARQKEAAKRAYLKVDE